MQYTGSLVETLVDMSTESLVRNVSDELTYRSYAYNRRQFPDVAPERWAKLFANQIELEKRFQSEL